MSIDRLKSTATAALRHKDLAWIMKEIPARYRDDPRVVKSMLAAATNGDPALVDDPSFKHAFAAVEAFDHASGLADRVAQLCDNPKIIAAASANGRDVSWYLERPAVAYEALMSLSRTDPSLLCENLRHEALLTVAEARDYSASLGMAEPTAPRDPMPATEAGRAARWTELIKKSVTPGERLTEEESAHLKALGGHEAALEEVRRQSAMRTPPASGEFDKLIQKSVSSKLTPAEEQRLQALATDRAIENGSIEAESSPPASDDELIDFTSEESES